MLWLWLACSGSSPWLTEPLALHGDGIVGVLSPATGGCQGNGVTVRMLGPTWRTSGRVAAQVTHEDDGVHWVRFPIETGLGDGEMVIRLQGRDAVIPFGARSGEFVETLSIMTELPTDEAWSDAQRVAEVGMTQEASLWRAGRFVLKDGDEVVGEVRFLGSDAPPMVSVHDLLWLTPNPVAAARGDDGGDVLLQFPVEPVLESEYGLLRINLLTRSVVIPSGPTPDSTLDRHLTMEAGALTEEERNQAIAAAMASADHWESLWIEEQLPALLRASEAANCASLDVLGEPWTLMFKGYRIEATPTDSGCQIQLMPDVVQHRRRIQTEVSSESR